MTTMLKQDEIKVAQQIWLDLKYGVPDAHDRLMALPENIRSAILKALVEAIDKRKTTNNPFDRALA